MGIDGWGGWDHPRSRGVYLEEDSALVDFLRSSPLARGLPGALAVTSAVGRILPARAGFTRSDSAGKRRSWDHPRSRGVYPQWPLVIRSTSGSSPLARGLHVLGFGSDDDSRIIPARAGFTPARPGTWPRPRIIPARAGFTRGPASRSRLRRDHPRSRGVYVAGVTWRVAPCGSSPLARGLRKG